MTDHTADEQEQCINDDLGHDAKPGALHEHPDTGSTDDKEGNQV
jgi:hypothetical protein